LSTFCAILTESDLASILQDHEWTVFAPNNDAFASLGSTFDSTHSLPLKILLFHFVVEDVLYSTDLVCDEHLRMVNGKNTHTLCVNDSIFQMGQGNDWDALPRIVSENSRACNANVFTIDQVLLPQLH
jgi:uncharacterized surface protein with fasciclin (FAS1) repeats